MEKYTLQYKTFDQLLAEVKSDFEAYDLEGLIKPYNLIKVAKRVTYDLGLKIHKTKNLVLEVENGKAKLPNDFMIMNYMYLLGHFETVTPLIQGTHVEQVPIDAPTYHPGQKSIDVCATPDPCPEPDPCPDECDDVTEVNGCQTWMNCKGETMQLIQKVKYETRKWSEFHRIHLTGDQKFFDPECPNRTWVAKNKAYIRDGWIYTSFKTGELYINYQGLMEDEHGNLLVLDHPMINEFYEYALKKRILELLLSNHISVPQGLIQLIHSEYRTARIAGKSIVNTPDYNEMKRVWMANRKAMFNRYYKMFT